MKHTSSSETLYGRISRSESSILALTSLTREEFQALAIEFAKDWTDYHDRYTLEDKPRHRRLATQEAGPLPSIEDKLLFICSYLKTYPIQELHAAIFGMEQSHTNVWIHRLVRFLFKTLQRLNHLPERHAQALAHLLPECERFYLDGTERPVQRSQDDDQQCAEYSGKKKDHTKENLVLCDGRQKVVYLSKTYPGSMVDITMARGEQMRLPHKTELLLDLGFVGFILPGVTIMLPHKKPRNEELSQEQKDYNVLLASARVVNEHAIGGIKRCRIVKDRLRNWKRDFDDTIMCLATGLHNLRVASRPAYARAS
jgi:DDE superfamily endonuclease/Helix-turn-helix of DDE superfamily endonuclease